MEIMKNKETIILKRWEKRGLTRAWSGDFQLAIMEAFTIISLFPTTIDIEKDMEIDEADTNPTVTTLIVMEGCLNEKSTFATSLETILFLQVLELKD